MVVLETGFAIVFVGVILCFLAPVAWGMYRRWIKWVDRQSDEDLK